MGGSPPTPATVSALVPTFVVLLFLLASATGASSGATTASADLDARVRAFFERTGTMLREGRLDAILAKTDSLIEESIAIADTAQLVALHTHRARQLWRSSRPRDAEDAVRKAIEIGEAWGDSLSLLEPVFVMTQAIDDQGRPPRVEPWLHRLVALSRAVGDEVYEARGRLFLARRALRSGAVEAALEDLRFARVAFATLPNDLTGVLLLLGLAHAQRGDWDPAREAWEECARLSREIDQPFMEAGAVTNLGSLEAAIGDPAAAAAALRTAHAIYVREGRARAAVIPGLGSAANLARLGDFGAANTMIDEMLQLVREHGLLDLEPMVLQVQGRVFALQGAPARARRALGVGLERARALEDPERTGGIAAQLTRILADRDSTVQAIELLERDVLSMAPQMRPPTRLQVQNEHARLLLRAGRHDEAAELLRECIARSGELGIRDQQVMALQIAASVELARGDSELARAHVDTAIARWESLRQVTDDPQWRESMGESGPLLAQTAVRVRLAAASDGQAANPVGELWELLQRLRTRTLLERMRGPSAPDLVDSTRIDVARLRAEVLTDGAVLLEAHWGPQDVTIFWIDQERCEVRCIDDAPGMRLRLLRLREMIEHPGEDGSDTIAQAARAIGIELFGDWAPRLATVERVLYSPEGPLARMPLDLFVPEVGALALRIPSAALLVAGGGEASGAGGLVVIEGTRDEAGRALIAARREVEWLKHRFRARPLLPSLAGLAPANLLHVAAHTRIDDDAPWRSAILVDAAESSPSWWTATEIAESPTIARVAVLASCASATGRALGGEGMLGIAQAFLSSGTRAVVATLWPVDDATAARFTQAFYEELAAGSTVTAATASARLRLREDPTTSHPFHWAAWVVIGRDDARVELAARPPSSATIALGLASILLLVWALVPAAARRGG